MFAALQQGEINELPIVIKGDVHGSIEAIAASLEKLNTDEVKVNILHQAVGAITESDITLARASQALIVGFNVRANNAARDAARAEGIDIRYFSIIYELLDDVKGLMSGLLKPEERENFWATPKFWKPSTLPRLAAWRVAGLPKGWSSAVQAFACCATTWLFTKERSRPCVVSRTRSKTSRTAWSAAWHSRIIRISSQVISSNVSRSSKLLARSNHYFI